MLSREQKEIYMTHGGSVCLYCLSDDISADPVEIDAGAGWGTVRCGTCGKSYRDIYDLVDVEETDD